MSRTFHTVSLESFVSAPAYRNEILRVWLKRSSILSFCSVDIYGGLLPPRWAWALQSLHSWPIFRCFCRNMHFSIPFLEDSLNARQPVPSRDSKHASGLLSVAMGVKFHFCLFIYVTLLWINISHFQSSHYIWINMFNKSELKHVKNTSKLKRNCFNLAGIASRFRWKTQYYNWFYNLRTTHSILTKYWGNKLKTNSVQA